MSAGSPGSGGALAGIKVVDLTRVMAGPYCTMMLGDMGADVIKIELPGRGDDTRAWRPPARGDESVYYLSVNRNKRSITIDLKSQAGREIVERMISRADVVVENFSPGTATRLGLGYDHARALKPDIVYCSISGFGQHGPGRDRTAYDLIVQGMSGLMSVTGPVGGEPMRFGTPIADIGAGMFGAFAIVGALFHRARTREGQFIDTSMFGGQLALLTYHAGLYFASGETPVSHGNAHPIVAPYQTFRAADGYLNVAIGNDSIWRRFCTAMDLDHLLDDDRFASNTGRITNLPELAAQIEERIGKLSTDEVMQRLDRAAVPGGPINTIPEALSDPQVGEYDLWQRIEHPTLGPVDQVGFPFVMEGTPCELRLPPPLLGQHTDEILAELGYSAEEIGAFHGEGVV